MLHENKADKMLQCLYCHARSFKNSTNPIGGPYHKNSSLHKPTSNYPLLQLMANDCIITVGTGSLGQLGFSTVATQSTEGIPLQWLANPRNPTTSSHISNPATLSICTRLD